MMRRVPPRRIAYHQPHCLGCGPENPGSLGLAFEIDGDRVRTELVLDRRHEGAPGFAHGGAVATAFDDTLGTLLIVLKRPGVTAKLEVNYRRPLFLGRRYELEAWVESVDGRKMWLAAEAREDGELVADARALFLEVDIAHFAQSQADGTLPEGWGRSWRRDPELPY